MSRKGTKWSVNEDGTGPATFVGKPCTRCGSTERLVSTKRCRPCNTRYGRQNYTSTTDREAHRGLRCPLCDDAMDQPCFDETDGRLRGWICHDCNKGLGWFRDRAWLLHRAARYVEEFARTGQEVSAEFLDGGEEEE